MNLTVQVNKVRNNGVTFKNFTMITINNKKCLEVRRSYKIHLNQCIATINNKVILF